MTQLGGPPGGLDWLMSLPDPRESGDEEGGSVLRPLRASAGGAPASRLQSVKQPGGAGGASSSSKLAARPVGGAVAGSSVAGRARRPGSAQHNSNKLSRSGGGSSNSGGGGANMLAGLNGAPSAGGGMAGAMSVSGASHPAAYPASGVGMARRVPKVQAPLAQTALSGGGAPSRPGGLGGGGSGLGAEMLSRKLTRTQSGLLPPRSAGGSGGGGGGGGGSMMAGGRGLARVASTGVLTPYNSQGLANAPGAAPAASKRFPGGLPLGSAGGGGSGRGSEASSERGSAASFRSEALQLEVRLAEGLQALQDAEEAAGADAVPNPGRRLQLFRSLFERIIERDAPFGMLLKRVKLEYEAALQAAAQPAEPQLERALAKIDKQAREVSDAKKVIGACEDEILELRATVARVREREELLREEIHAYEEHAYEMQQSALAHAEAEHAAMTAELERELPKSARPAEVTPSLGEGVLHTVDEVTPPPRPSIVPALDMWKVAEKREADAKAEAEEDAAAKAAEPAAAPGAAPPAMAPMAMAPMGFPPGGAPPSGAPYGYAHGYPPAAAPAADADSDGAEGWGGDDDDDDDSAEALPRVLSPASAAPLAATAGIGIGLPKGMPALNMKPLTDPASRPMGYQAEFEATVAESKANGTAATPTNPTLAAVDDMLYANDPTYKPVGAARVDAPAAAGDGKAAGKAAAAAAEAGTAGEGGAKASATATTT